MPPTTTYRLQLRAEFGFEDAARIVPYLAELGVSHVYCSPVLQAAPGSAHGYDVVDHSKLSEELGGDSGWQRLLAACADHQLRIVVDVVPNHMAAPTPARLNPAFWDVLRHGHESPYSDWFDVDWDSQDGKLMVPVLGQPLAGALRDGEVTVYPDAGLVRYFDHEFPMAPGTTRLEEQHYRLCFWRVGNDELNYRRFFDVTTLLGVRVELPDVFRATHERLLAELGPVDGLRIDHPDGLADPAGYLSTLAKASDGTWTVVEKILEAGEQLPKDWHCAGTTGYDTLNQITSMLTDPAGEKPLTDLYAELCGEPRDFELVVEKSKRLVIRELFGAEVDRLVGELMTDAAATEDDLTRRGVREALEELVVALPVYRVYDGDPASQQKLAEAVDTAVTRLPRRTREIRWVGERASLTRFRQTTGPVMAKGVEDTAFYRWHRLLCLTEVGGDPATFSRPVSDWHAWCERLASDWPATMTALSTHDTKRSEDVRARIAVLSEIPNVWRSAVTRWRDLAQRHGPPDANTEYLMWQTIVGAWPITADRLSAYLEKATREAKLLTSWTDPDEQYDERLRRYVHNVLGDADLITDIEQWLAEHVIDPGRSNSLSQKLLQLTMPGVADIYQGTELEDLSLVDPDNRRAVDYDLRAGHLADRSDAKLNIVAAAARARRDYELVGASYTPVEVTGVAGDHVIGFRRGENLVTVVTRLPHGLASDGGWRDTTVGLPDGEWRNAFTGRIVASGRCDELLADLPVALLLRDRR